MQKLKCGNLKAFDNYTPPSFKRQQFLHSSTAICITILVLPPHEFSTTDPPQSQIAALPQLLACRQTLWEGGGGGGLESPLFSPFSRAPPESSLTGYVVIFFCII